MSAVAVRNLPNAAPTKTNVAQLADILQRLEGIMFEDDAKTAELMVGSLKGKTFTMRDLYCKDRVIGYAAEEHAILAGLCGNGAFDLKLNFLIHDKSIPEGNPNMRFYSVKDEEDSSEELGEQATMRPSQARDKVEKRLSAKETRLALPLNKPWIYSKFGRKNPNPRLIFPNSLQRGSAENPIATSALNIREAPTVAGMRPSGSSSASRSAVAADRAVERFSGGAALLSGYNFKAPSSHFACPWNILPVPISHLHREAVAQLEFPWQGFCACEGYHIISDPSTGKSLLEILLRPSQGFCCSDVVWEVYKFGTLSKPCFSCCLTGRNASKGERPVAYMKKKYGGMLGRNVFTLEFDNLASVTSSKEQLGDMKAALTSLAAYLCCTYYTQASNST